MEGGERRILRLMGFSPNSLLYSICWMLGSSPYKRMFHYTPPSIGVPRTKVAGATKAEFVN
jgi:hypothetical protein